jgi:hypothetical protein
VNDIKRAAGSWLRNQPRTTVAVAFGTLTTALMHVAWVADARFSGVAPLLTVAAGLAHAIAGAVAAPRLMDRTRTTTASQACLVGACASLGALALWTPALVLWIQADNTRADLISSVALIPLVGVFSFLAVGWAMLLLCAAISWSAFQLAA